MSTAPEIRIMVTREMIEAHYKSVMNAALTLLSQDCVALAQNLLSEAIRLPYPTPAPASMPEPAGRENLGSMVDAIAAALLAKRDAGDTQ